MGMLMRHRPAEETVPDTEKTVKAAEVVEEGKDCTINRVKTPAKSASSLKSKK